MTAYTYKLTSLLLNNGAEMTPGSLTVIIGPNNVGKSRMLKDIVSMATTPQLPTILIRDVQWTTPESVPDLRDAYDIEPHQDESGNWIGRMLNPDLFTESRIAITNWPRIEANMRSRDYFAKSFGKAMIAHLTTENRLQLVKESASPGDDRQTSNLLQALYRGGREQEVKIRSLVRQAFGQDIALDFTGLQRLLLRVGKDFSGLPLDPRDARPAMLREERLDDQGDGIRSFVGVVVALHALRRSVFLIDEPEAFLHPPQAFRMGEFLASMAATSTQLIVATHSADVLRGVLHKTQDVSILRIDRTDAGNSFHHLDAGRLKELVTDPLLSSARVLDGLFYSAALVVEADSDARFYGRVASKRNANLDIHFVNADNKQTVPKITEMYRDMGVRCGGIVDFDVLNSSVEFEKQLKALKLSEILHTEAVTLQSAIASSVKEVSSQERLAAALKGLTELKASLDGAHVDGAPPDESVSRRLLREAESRCQRIVESTKAWAEYKKKGRGALPTDARKSFDRLFGICAEEGLFINPCGELESMLVEFGIPTTSDKRGWIVQALQLLPSLQVDDSKYPWRLMKTIHDHLSAEPS